MRIGGCGTIPTNIPNDNSFQLISGHEASINIQNTTNILLLPKVK